MVECGINERVTEQQDYSRKPGRTNQNRIGVKRIEYLISRFVIIFVDVCILPGVSHDTFPSCFETSPFARTVAKGGTNII